MFNIAYLKHIVSTIKCPDIEQMSDLNDLALSC